MVFDTKRGDTILLYSDGVQDQLNREDGHYTRTRIHSLLKEHGSGTPLLFANAIFAGLDEFRDGVPITDDQTVVAMKVVG